MRRTNTTWRARTIGYGTLALASILVAATPAIAVQANFDSTGTGFIPSVDVMALPTATIDITTPMFGAGDTSDGGPFTVGFTGSSEGSVCILASTMPGVCQANLSQVSTPYSMLVTLDISAIDVTKVDGPFTLVLSQLQFVSDNPNMDVYTSNEVSLQLNPVVPVPLNTNGSTFDGSFDPIVRIVDQACSNSGGDCNYLGWSVVGLGGMVTFQIDLLTAPNGRDTPTLLFNAIPVVVPEPGTALLLAMGLAGLSFGSRRIGSAPRTPSA